MADKTNTSKNKAVSSSSPDRWRSGRPRFNLVGFWRGQDRDWYFSGQQPGEDVRLVVRRHWWFLVLPALPLLGFTFLFFIVLWVGISFSISGAFWWLLELTAFLGMLVTGAWFAYKDLTVWWFETYIITNKRIINARGLLEPTRQQTPLEKVQQVGVDVNRMSGLFLGFGTIHVYLIGGDFYIRDVPRPRQVRDAIIGIKDEITAAKPKDVPSPKPKNADLVAIIDQLAKEKDVDSLPDADQDLPPLPDSERYRGPRRTFGGILSIPCNVRYLSGEYTVKYIQRSQYVLIRNLLIPILLFIVVFPVTLLGASWVPNSLMVFWWTVSIVVLAAIFLAGGLIYFNYADDVYIITNRRIIDIERFFAFFFERHLETELKNIKEIKVKVGNVVERFLDIGDVYIETPGKSRDIVLSKVDHPFVLQDEIVGIRSHKEKVDAANKENAEKKNLNKWFSAVILALEETAVSRGTPSLYSLDLLEAMEHAQAYGLEVVVSGEAVDSPHIPPGCVIHQSPPPGALMEKGSKIEVVLSRRPVPVD